MKFYSTVMSKLLATNRVTVDDSVLAICAGSHDRDSLLSCGFKTVKLSNVNAFMGADVAPYSWDNVDAENLKFPDRSFDIVVVHGGLHHCYSPHRAFTEMMRVARKAVVVMEARDSLMMRIGVLTQFTHDYELEAVTGQLHYGGAGGGPMPNFVYRWTETEVQKVVSSFEPRFKPDIEFHYGLLLPHQRVENSPQSVKRFLMGLIKIVVKMIFFVMPKQGNRFGFVVWKDKLALQPWLERKNDEIVVDQDYVIKTGRHYTPPKGAK
jgi:SAM-dependent methyltransferase